MRIQHPNFLAALLVLLAAVIPVKSRWTARKGPLHRDSDNVPVCEATWTATVTYTRNDKVSFNGINWISKANANSIQPQSDSSEQNWRSLGVCRVDSEHDINVSSPAKRNHDTSDDDKDPPDPATLEPCAPAWDILLEYP
ncbi:hypothetical protein HDU78_006085, partial [Chytriomyces hyalinus]